MVVSLRVRRRDGKGQFGQEGIGWLLKTEMLRGAAESLLWETDLSCSQRYTVIHRAAGLPAACPAQPSWSRPVPGRAGWEPLVSLSSSSDSGFPPAEQGRWLFPPPHPSVGPQLPAGPSPLPHPLPPMHQRPNLKAGTIFPGDVAAGSFTANKPPCVAAQLGSHTRCVY